MIGHINSTMEGLTTIRAYKAQDILRDEFDKHQDLYTSAHFTSFLVGGAFSFYMNSLSVMYITYIICRFLFYDVGE